MTTMSTLNAASLLTSTASLNMGVSAVSASKLATQDSSVPEPSTIVTISQAGSTSSPPTYSLPGKPAVAAPIVTWASSTNDAVTMTMAGDYGSQSLTNRFYGLGSALLDRFKTTGSEFSQSVQVTPAGSLSTVGQTVQGVQADIKLTVKTKTGVEVDITLHSEEDGLAVSVQSSGKLSDTERSALEKLSGAFQDALNGLGAIPPTLDLNGLTQFDPSVLSSVDLQSSVTGTGQAIRSISFHADSSARTVSVSGPAGTMKVDVDMTDSAIWGSQSQRAGAIDAYLKQFDQASSRGHGDASFTAMFKDAFTQMNSNYGVLSQPLPGTSYAPSLGQADHAMLTGLADFSASITDTPRATNPMRLNEQDSFSYQVSQRTDIHGGAMDGTISQRQQSHLSASYHTPLSANAPLALTSMRNSQNYSYVQIDDTADSMTNIENKNGQIINASLSQSADQSTRTSKYVSGDLVSDITTPVEASGSQDLLALLKPLLANGQAEQDSGQWQQALANIHGMILLQSDPASLNKDPGASP